MNVQQIAGVIPPGTHLKREMEARGWTTEDVALRMGWRTEHEFVIDLLSIDLLMSVQEDSLLLGSLPAKLARAFDVSETYIRNLDAIWRRWPDRRVAFQPPVHIFGEHGRLASERTDG